MKKQLRLYLENKIYYPILLYDIIRSYLNYIKEKRAVVKFNIPIIDLGCKNINNNENKLFFILGGGTSINKLRKKDWELIDDNFSIGLNFWITHPFEPNYLMIEGFRADEVDSSGYKWVEKYMPVYVEKSRSTILLKDFATSFKNWEYFSNLGEKKVFVIPKFSIPGRTNESKRRAMRVLKKIKIADNYPLFSRASVTLAISIGYLLGFKKIILCGIDMHNAKYFYEEKDFISHPHIPPPPDSGQLDKGLHSTVNKEINPITADRSILNYYEQILKDEGINLYVNSEDSLLFPRIPAFKWNEHQHV